MHHQDQRKNNVKMLQLHSPHYATTQSLLFGGVKQNGVIPSMLQFLQVLLGQAQCQNHKMKSSITAVAGTSLGQITCLNRWIAYVQQCHRTAFIPCTTGSTELFLANHLNNNKNIPLLEVLPWISNHFQWIVSTHTSTLVAYSGFTVNLYHYFPGLS